MLRRKDPLHMKFQRLLLNIVSKVQVSPEEKSEKISAVITPYGRVKSITCLFTCCADSTVNFWPY